jgi:hypothetical protein
LMIQCNTGPRWPINNAEYKCATSRSQGYITFAMTMTLELTADQEARLLERAKAAGMDDARAYVLALIESQTDSLIPKTAADVLAYWKREGLDSLFEGKPDSPEFARELRRAAQTREHVA